MVSPLISQRLTNSLHFVKYRVTIVIEMKKLLDKNLYQVNLVLLDWILRPIFGFSYIIHNF